MKNFTLFLAFVIINSLAYFTQVSDSNSILNTDFQKKDSTSQLDTSSKNAFQQIIIENDFAFLIDENKYYKCKVLKIHSIYNGNLIELETLINDKTVFIDIITTNNKNKRNSKIKVNSIYSMKLIRYFNKPLSRSIEYKPVYNILLGADIFSILSTGAISYLFVSPNLDGLNYSSTINFDEFENFSRKKENATKEFICNFIRAITFKEDSALLLGYVDTISIIKTFNRFSIPFVVKNPDDKISKKQPYKLPKLNWQNLSINPENFNSLFWGMLDYYYKVPFNKKKLVDNDLLCSNIRTKLIYSYENIYTFKLNWNFISHKRNYESIISIKENGNNFIVIGLTINPF